ncbi:MAG TPA: response regulator [Bacteroidota bacterium]|nr:response regulator [Bacteroidota bacterium]
MKILVVDDDEGIKMILRRLISLKLLVTPIEASNGLEGLLKVEKESPDMVLLDLGMPLKGGVEFLEKLRESKTYASLPVVVISSSNDKDVVAKLINLGISGYILKPLDYEKTFKVINDVVGKIKLQKN